jgi:hypothetical protein
MTIDERVQRLEALTCRPSLYGTIISRVLPNAKGDVWSVGIGEFMGNKEFFLGKSIEEALTKAEEKFCGKDKERG